MLTRLLNKRIILLPGKGGVGRTTLAGALALAAAREGNRTLLCEIGDPEGGGSPLAQLFGRDRFNAQPAELALRLDGVHLWAPYGQELFLRHTLPGGRLIGAAMRSKALQTFLSAAPSFLEMGWFYHFMTLLEAKLADGSPRFQTVVLDMPATGHALALTALPDILQRLIQRGPVVEALQRGQRYLNNPEHTAAWVVTLPESLPVTEAMEMVAGLEDTKVPVGGIILNRCPVDPFTAAEREELAPYLADEDLFGSVAYHRIRRARAAEARLASELGRPLVKVPELQVDASHLLGAIASELQLEARAEDAFGAPALPAEEAVR